MAINQGGAPIGAMIIGVMADRFGVRWALALASVVVLVAALISTMVVRRRRIEQSEEILVEDAFEPASIDED
jgi:membrane protein implicated in regulation of membrane protease activity